MSDNPTPVPWHVANPYHQTLEHELDENQRAVQGPEIEVETEDDEQFLEDVSLAEAASQGMDHAVQEATNNNDDTQKFPDIAPGDRPMPRLSRNPQIVKSGASFNSPWVIEEKPARLMPDDEIQSSRIFELYKLQAVHFELREGDTLVFVDYPAPSARSSILDCYGTAYSSRQFRVNSEKLLATGSSLFKELLSPTRQFRTQRRRKVVNKLPEGVKYVIDLTPPSEGDDLVFAMTELSLTPGIIKWWMADRLHGVDSCLVNGHDDVCNCMREKLGTSTLDPIPTSPIEDSPVKESSNISRSNPTKNPPSPETLVSLREAGQKLGHEVPHYREIPDYCPVRHCNSIVRLLMLIEGHNVILDSASRVWTLLGISKILDCPLILRDKVVQWLMYGVNARFIEVLPEEALKVGFTLQLPDITQCAFRILVNELALDLTASSLGKEHAKPGVTIFGRKRGDVGDELDNLIQHAAQAFVDRVESQMNVLEDKYVCENLRVEEWSRLLELEEALAQTETATGNEFIRAKARFACLKIQDLKQVLDMDFKTSLGSISTGRQTQHGAAYHSIDIDRASYVVPEDFHRIEDVLDTLTKTQRRLCAFFYHDLMYMCEGLLSAKGLQTARAGPGPRAGQLVAEIREDLEAIHEEDPSVVPMKFSGIHPVERFTAIHLFTYRHQLNNAVQPVAQWWHRHNIDPPLNITRHLLLTLGPNELKFLPLWAGGDNDGTGGVFEPSVPSTDMGPNGPGPSFHTGMTIPSATSSVSGSLMDEIRNMHVRGSTTAGSVDVHDSISTVYHPDRIIADDKSIVSESFTASDSGQYAEARYREPADHQEVGKAVEMVVESGTENSSVVGSTTSRKKVKDMTAEDWEVDDGSDSGSDTLSDSSMVML